MTDLVDIQNGMTFEELLANGDDSEEMYNSLLADLVDQIELATSPGVDSDLNKLVEELLATDNPDQQQLVANAICAVLTKFTEQLDELIDGDLQAQQRTRDQLNSLNIAAALVPSSVVTNSTLFDTIATDSFKNIVAGAS